MTKRAMLRKWLPKLLIPIAADVDFVYVVIVTVAGCCCIVTVTVTRGNPKVWPEGTLSTLKSGRVYSEPW